MLFVLDFVGPVVEIEKGRIILALAIALAV